MLNKMKNNRLKPFIKQFIFAGILVITIVLMTYISSQGSVQQIFQQFTKWQQEQQISPLTSIISFTLVGAFMISLGIPRLWISAAAGAIFHITIGTFIAIFSSILGASFLYWVGKYFLSNFIITRCHKYTNVLHKKLKKKSFISVVYIRLFPFTNATITSLFLGSMNIPFKHYFFGSIIGYLPLGITFVIIGAGSAQFNIIKISVGFMCILAIIIIKYIFKRYSHKKEIVNAHTHY